MTYKEQLKTKEWKYKRLDILLRDRFTCVCGYKNYNRMHVHHKEYISNLMAWEYPNKLLVTLCNDCHRKVHFNLIDDRRIEKLSISSIMKKYSDND